MTMQPAHTRWSDAFALDLALLLEGSGEGIDELRERYDFSVDDLARFQQDPVLHQRITAYQKDIKERGLGFKLKARSQAEELLTTSWHLIHDRETSPAVKADLIKSTVKWAGYEPRGMGDDAGNGVGGSVTISINLGGQDFVTTGKVDTGPETLEHNDGH